MSESIIPYGTIKFPDGSLSKSEIAQLLSRAHKRGLKVNQKVEVLIHKRLAGCNPEHPDYETIRKQLSIRTLRNWYKWEEGESFNPNTHDHSPRISERINMIFINPRTWGLSIIDIWS